MDIKLGNLRILPIKGNLHLVAPSVKEALLKFNMDEIGVAEINSNFSDTTQFCQEYQIQPNQAANCVILEAKSPEKRWLAACVILATTRIDVNKAACDALGAKRASFAPMEKAVQESRMEYGAITPIGLPADWPILIDKAVAESDYVIIGSGVRGSKIAITGKMLASLPNVKVVNGLAK